MTQSPEIVEVEETNIFEIPENKLSPMFDQLKKLNRRAKKLGCPEITITPTGNVRDVEIKQRQPGWWGGHGWDGTGIFIRLVEVELVGDAPMIEGWQFVATLQHEQAGNILRKVPGSVELPVEYRTRVPKCEHCSKARNRKDTYVLFNEETNQYKQVGRTCLRDFTGVNNPEKIARVAAQFCEFVDELHAIEDYENVDDDYWRSSATSNEVRFKLETYLTFVACMVRNHGWVSRGKAYEWNKAATADLASTAMFYTKGERAKYGIEEPEEQDFEKAQASLAWVREQLTARLDEQNNGGKYMSDYEWNLHMAISEEVIEYRSFGIAASLVAWYGREMEEYVKKEKDTRTNEYIGEIKVRQQFDNLTVISEKSFEGSYGMTYLYKFEDETGNEIVWWASRGQWFGQNHAHSNDEVEGWVVSGKATVKKHDVYNGRKQTTITRAKFKKVEAQNE